MTKKLLVFILVTFMLFSVGMTQITLAAQPIALAFDGKVVPLATSAIATDDMLTTGYYIKSSPEIKDGCSFVPIRAVCEVLLGGLVDYNGSDDITVFPEKRSLNSEWYYEPYYARISIGDTEVQYITSEIVNGVRTAKNIETRQLKGAPYLSEKKELMIPIAVITELFGYYAEYSDGIVNINTAYNIAGVPVYGIQSAVRTDFGSFHPNSSSPFIAKKITNLLTNTELKYVEEPEHWIELAYYNSLPASHRTIPYCYLNVMNLSLKGFQDSKIRSFVIYQCNNNAFPEGYTEYLLYTHLDAHEFRWYAIPDSEIIDQIIAWFEVLT